MRLPFLEILLTALLAAAFCAAGELVLRRLSQGLAEANEAMLVGMGVSAAALFPLTLAFPHGALVAEAVLLGLCLLCAAGARIHRRKPFRAPKSSSQEPGARTMLAAVCVAAAGFAALNFRYQYLWDGFLIWATKAQLLFHAGGLTKQWFANDVYDLRHLTYPPLVPLYEALVSLVRGGFDFDRFKPPFFVFYMSLLTGTYATARPIVSARRAAVATLLVALVPTLSTLHAAGAYADMPQAAFVAGVTAAAMSGRKEALPWLIGALTTVKAEGTILAAVACAGVALFWILDDGRENLRGRIVGAAGAIAVVVAFFGIRFAYLRWLSVADPAYQGGLAGAVKRIPTVIRLCAAQLLDPRHWGLFWPAFGASALVLFSRGSAREKTLATATAVGLAVLTVPVLFTTWPLDLQIAQAYDRLAAQLAPAAAVAMVLAYARFAPSPEARG